MSLHIPVLLEAVLRALAPRPGGRFLDGTVGDGGHTEALLIACAPDGLVLALDRDPAALSRTLHRLGSLARRCLLRRGSFADLGAHLDAEGWGLLDGILLDLGISSPQLADPDRGFSFQSPGPLDMRLDPSGGRTAADLVNGLSEAALAEVLYRFGEERRSRRIARAIVAARPVTTTTALAEVVAGAVGRGGGRIHPATRTFQALRIAVNEELEALADALPQAVDRLAPGGRLAVISFHSLEDRTVKQFLRAASSDCVCPPDVPECRCQHRATLRLLTRRPIAPSPVEVEANPRSRSARLRVAERLPEPTVLVPGPERNVA